MRYNKLIALAALAAVLLPGCSRILEEDNAAGEKQALRFTASVGSYATKATDRAFEIGDAVSLYTYSPVYQGNIKLEYDGQTLVPETPVYWSDSQYLEETTEFWAFYPYMENEAYWDGQYFVVRTNQSTHQGFTASDFMTAHTLNAPVDGTVHLHFVHRLSKLLVYVDNQLADVDIAEAYLGNVTPEAMINRNGETYGVVESEYSALSSIKMGQVLDAAGRPAWACIIPPQWAQPSITLVGTDGKYYTYALSYEVRFQPGCRHTARVELDADTVSAEFSKDVDEWVDNDDANHQSNPRKATVEEVLKADDGEVFIVSAIVRDLSSIQYGNYYLVDDINSEDALYIYGTVNAEGLFPKDSGGWYSDGWGFVQGDRITVKGIRATYNGMVEFKNAELVSIDALMPIGMFTYQNKIEAVGGQALFTVRGVGDWDIFVPRECTWATVNELQSLGNDWYYLTVDVERNTSTEERQAILYVDLYAGDENYRTGDYITQAASTGETYIIDVINGADGDTFTVTGEVYALANLSYGNFYIQDDSGELYIYGAKTADGQYPKDAGGWYTEQFGLVAGDVVTVTGAKTTYNGTVELVDVQIESVERADFGLVLLSTSAAYTGGAVTNMVRCVETPVFTSDQNWAQVSYQAKDANWYEFTTTLSENESLDSRTVRIYVSYSNRRYYFDITQDGAPAPIVNDGTLENPYTVTEARTIASALSWTNNSTYDQTDPVYVKGVVAKITRAFKANDTAVIFISDDGVDQDVLQLYNVWYVGNEPFADGDVQPEVGDTVVVYGPLMNYRGNTPETVSKQAYLVSIN